MKRSAGLILYRRGERGVEVFLVHPGGPYYRGKDDGVWTIPKGEIEPGEEPLEVAKREFAEETGQSVEVCARDGSLMSLGTVRLKSGKIVEAWAFEGDWPEGAVLESNLFTLEWPPRSGAEIQAPEVDRGEFFTPERARLKVNPAQAELIDRLLRILDRVDSTSTS